MTPTPPTPPPRPATSVGAAIALVAALLVGLTWTAAAQEARPPNGANPLEAHLFPPDLVMSHQTELALTPEQRQRLVAEVQALQSDLVPLQFEMGQVTEELNRLLQPSRVDEAAALARAEEITSLESRVKRRHLQLLIRIKNLLTAEQQAALRRLRAAH